MPAAAGVMGPDLSDAWGISDPARKALAAAKLSPPLAFGCSFIIWPSRRSAWSHTLSEPLPLSVAYRSEKLSHPGRHRAA
jgi:hypothetical protein